jgi:sugar phosphate permease
MITIAFSIYLPYIKTEVGLSYTETSMINTIRYLSTMLVMMWAGKYYGKLSLRLGTSVSCLFLAGSCIVFSQANSAMMCYLAAILMGITYALGTMIPISILVRNWFVHRRSTAMGIAACGSSLSTIIAPPIITLFVEGHSLQKMFMVEALFVVAVAVILFLVLRDSPSDMGLAPYQEDGYGEKREKNRSYAMDCDMSKMDIFLLMSAMFLVGVEGPPSSTHLASHLRGVNYTGMQVAAATSLIGIVMAAGKFIYGVTSDRFGTYRVNYVYLLSWIMAMYIAAILPGSWPRPMLYTMAIFNGFGSSVGMVGSILWVVDLSPPQDYTRNIQRSQTLFSLGALLGGPVPGIIADVTGTYKFAYVLFVIIMAVNLIVIQPLYHRHRHKLNRPDSPLRSHGGGGA